MEKSSYQIEFEGSTVSYRKGIYQKNQLLVIPMDTPFTLALWVTSTTCHQTVEGGGFTVWSKSHRKLYFNYHSSHRNEPTDQHEKDIAYFNQQTYVDCHGQAGDIVFWHHRLAHAVGHNRSRQIWQAVLYDFRRKDMDQVMKEPPSQDMWRDWPGITNLRRNVQFDQG